MASVAEFYVIDDKGERISREPWTVVYADSEEVKRGNRAADKLFDLQESTFWSTTKGSEYPHSFVLDLGAEHKISEYNIFPEWKAEFPEVSKTIESM